MNAKKHTKDQQEKKIKTEGKAGEEIKQENPQSPQEAEVFAEEAGAVSGEVLEGPEADAKSQQEIEQLKDQLLRLNADFDNFRKRTSRDKQDWSRYASQTIVEKLLPVVDGLDAAALAVNSSGQEAKSVAEGFLMIQKQLLDILGQEGLAEIPALDQEFDPNVHEAVMTIACTGDQKDNQIVMVLRKGYMYKDKVLRPSMVQVAKKE
ncbi:MAG: nucleotide exchange factor GrpE [Clostridiales bacterium]